VLKAKAYFFFAGQSTGGRSAPLLVWVGELSSSSSSAPGATRRSSSSTTLICSSDPGSSGAACFSSFGPPSGAAGGFEPQQVEIVFRSTYEIFRYLGALTDEQATSAASDCSDQPVNAPPTICDYTTPDTPKPIGPILWIQTDKAASSCFTAVTYSNRRYCVPKGGADLDMTKDAFNILISLLALKQSPGDLPTPQAVLLQ